MANSGNRAVTRPTTGTNHDAQLMQHVDGVDCYVDGKTSCVLNNKQDTKIWTFTITTKARLTATIMRNSESFSNFSIKSISVEPNFGQKYVYENCGRKWKNPEPVRQADRSVTTGYKIQVEFQTQCYGSFKQTIVIAFDGVKGFLYRELKVIVRQEEIKITGEDLTFTESMRWESLPDVQIVRTSESVRDKGEDLLVNKYKRPEDLKWCTKMVDNCGEVSLLDNYRLFYHSLLYIEEAEQFHLLSKLNLSGIITFTSSYTAQSVTDDTTHYANLGTLFGKLPLSSNLSEDTVQGRILLQNVNFLLLCGSSHPHPRKVYECKILQHCKDFLMLNIPKGFIQDFGIAKNTSRKCQVQFVVNRVPFCELHSILDKLTDVSMLFPTRLLLDATSHLHSLEAYQNVDCELRLNDRQREGLQAIVSKPKPNSPPVLMIGPFGTGKTMTVATGVLHLLTHSDSRILICTHSNSAADLYIEDYIHPYIAENNLESAVKVVRVYYKHRWTSTASQVLQSYSLMGPGGQSFREPTLADLTDANVVVTTLSTSFSLSQLNLPAGFFTHIMIDEAAQAKELETLIPLTLADTNTKILMAGDHMQMNPEVCSVFARRNGLQRSLFERMTHLYPDNHPSKVTLNVNYRSHKQLVKYSSQLFYEDKLMSGGRKIGHPLWQPLTFLAARGESQQQEHGTGYSNQAEVYETMDFLTKLVSEWPIDVWGPFDQNSIGVVLPYMDQVTMLRAMLKQHGDSQLKLVSVERVYNVQGKQFRVIIINTVRTHHSCRGIDEDVTDYGYLTNPKLLNTAITRAQSLVVTVGDPFSLCTVGKCRKVWINFLENCSRNGSLYGVTFAQLQDYMDYIDTEKEYKLNPHAEEFVGVKEHNAIETNSHLKQTSTTAQAHLHSQQLTGFAPHTHQKSFIVDVGETWKRLTSN